MCKENITMASIQKVVRDARLLDLLQERYTPRYVNGDSVEIDDYSQAHATSCKKGLIAYVDNITITARVNADVDAFKERIDIWILHDYKKPHHPHVVGFICAIKFKATCNINETIDFMTCYCKGYHKGSFEILGITNAETGQSEGKAFVRWHKNAFDYIESRKVTLPVIYPQEQVSLIVGKTEVDLSNCAVNFETKDDAIFFCVYNLLAHTLKISFDYDKFESNENCTRRVLDFARSTSNYFNLSYVEHEGCERHKIYTCRWNAPAIKEGQRSTNGGNIIDWKVDGWTVPMIMMICFHGMFEIGFLHDMVMI